MSSSSSFPTAPSVAWSHLSGGGIESAAALTETQAFFASANEDTEQGTIFGLNRATGARDWVLPVESMCLASGAVGDGALFLGCDDKVLHALEQRTGAERWSHAAGGEFTGGAAFSAAQNLVISGSSKPSEFILLRADGGACSSELNCSLNGRAWAGAARARPRARASTATRSASSTAPIIKPAHQCFPSIYTVYSAANVTGACFVL